MRVRPDQAGAFAKTMEQPKLLHAGAVHPRGVKMRDCWKNRAGYDRVLIAVAATFLTVSATSALAQGDQVRNSAAELAIDAAIPRPEPANVPPPTPNDFKLDTASAPDAAKMTEKTATETKPATRPADVVTVPISEPAKTETSKAEPTRTDSPKSEPA